MRLRHIKLAGFKSFAEPTTIPVAEARVAVVGPNGCGKSNVIDAVRWVLGESSAKQLRGESMSDVIFNGAASRPPASRASAELLFDNGDFALSGEWGRFSEIAVKRTLNRAGESSYFINGQAVRRRDITDLFLGTGVGARGYAVIEQGMINRIIEAKPEDLRAFIEEAAGVSKYKERRRETETRLRETGEHLERLTDVRGELDRQAAKLRTQAQTAQNFRALKNDLLAAQNRLDFLLWQEALDRADENQKEHNRFQAACNELNARKTACDEDIFRLQTEEYASREREDESNRAYTSVREEMARLHENLRQCLEMRKRHESETADRLLESEHTENRLRELIPAEQALGERCLAATAAATEARERVNALARSLPELTTRAETAAKAWEEAQTRLRREREQDALRRQNLAHNAREKESLRQRLPATTDPVAVDFSDDEQALAQLRRDESETQQKLKRAEDLRRDAENRQAQAERELRTLEQQKIALEAEYRTWLSSLPQEADGDFWRLFPEVRGDELWQKLDIDPPLARAVSLILGERLRARRAHALTPPADTCAGAAWIDRNPEVPTDPSPFALMRRLRCPEPFRAALALWLDGALVAENLGFALKHRDDLRPHQYFITPEGHRVDGAGVTLAGKGEEASLPERRARTEAAAAALAALDEPLARAEQLSGSLKKQIADIAPEYRRLRESGDKIKENIAAGERDLFRKKTEAQALEQARRDRLREREQSLSHIAALDAEDQNLKSRIAEAQKLIADAEKAVEAAHERYREARARADAARDNIVGEERLAHKLDLEAGELRRQHENMLRENDELRRKLEELQNLLRRPPPRELDEEVAQQCRSRLENLREQSDALNKTLAELRQEGKARRQKINELRASLAAAEGSLNDERERMSAADLAAREARLIAERHLNNLRERGADIALLIENREHGQSPALLNQSIADIARAINRLGAVNLAADEELTEIDERRNELTRQEEDLRRSVDLLRQAMNRIDDESEKLFRQTFERANELMRRRFSLLFGGGEARLILDGDGGRDAGVLVQARPPGKNPAGIRLLSGGEKTLTAVSLVFSLFALNPAPFCLLDEVDAPLDDANTARFCRLLEDMSDKTQFLYISHNRLTMETAQRLVGVTMREKGVSRIVAVDLRTALAMEKNS